MTYQTLEHYICFFLLLLTWICFCRSGGTVNFTLPFMTNVTISISTSQSFRSWVAIFQPRPPMASLFRSLYGMPGLAPRMDVLSWGRRDFQISFSNRDTSRNAWNRHWGSFMVDTGILSNNMKFPSHKCYMIRLCTELDLLPNFEWFPFWTCICSTCWDQSFSELVVILPDYALRISLRYYLDFAFWQEEQSLASFFNDCKSLSIGWIAGKCWWVLFSQWKWCLPSWLMM